MPFFLSPSLLVFYPVPIMTMEKRGEDFAVTEKRKKDPEKRTPKPGTFTNIPTLPINIDPQIHKTLSITSADSKKLSISVEPSEKPMTVVATWKSRLSLTTENGVHTLTLPSNSRVAYLELTEENTELMVDNGNNIRRNQVLAKTTSPPDFLS